MWGDLYGDTKEWMDLDHMRPAMTKNILKKADITVVYRKFFIIINLVIS